MNENGHAGGAQMESMVHLVGKTLTLEVLLILSQGPHDVGEVADRLELDITTVSRMLRQLYHARFVVMEREKTRHIYALGPDLSLVLNSTMALIIARSKDGVELTLRVPRQLVRGTTAQ